MLQIAFCDNHKPLLIFHFFLQMKIWLVLPFLCVIYGVLGNIILPEKIIVPSDSLLQQENCDRLLNECIFRNDYYSEVKQLLVQYYNPDLNRLSQLKNFIKLNNFKDTTKKLGEEIRWTPSKPSKQTCPADTRDYNFFMDSIYHIANMILFGIVAMIAIHLIFEY